MYPKSFFLKLVEKDLTDFEEFLHHASDADVRSLLAELHPADIADIVERIEEDSQARLMGLLDTQGAAEVLSLVEEHRQPDVVEAISDEKLPEILDEMDSDDVADILDDLPEEDAEEILGALPKEESEEVRQLMTYDEETAGGLMQTELVKVTPELTMAQAAEKVRELAEDATDIQNIYVVDREGVLKGFFPMQKLILEPPDKKVGEVIEEDYFSVPADLDQEEVAEMFQKYDLLSLPVVDKNGVLLGRIMVDDIVDVIQEEASEDIYRLAGVDTEEHVSDSPFRSVRLRLPWLSINVLTAMVAASVVGLFQETIQKAVILAVFMPIVASVGGNAGTQSLAVITRGIALGDLEFGNAKKALLKEITAGIVNGIIVGVILAIVGFFWAGKPVLGYVLGLAMICNMFVATFTGTAIPLILKWAKVDPALASGVIVTAFTDMAGFFSFLGLATLFMHYLA
ncbi:MAG: magnesium transporter [bacterium]|nr:magnesium transporter [bacterium]